MRLLFLGPPGSGKGTQSSLIREELNIPQLSTGDMLRQAVAAGSELGRKAKEYMDQGSLVPDDIIIGLMKVRTTQSDCKSGYILDGFPRTVPQAVALDEMLKSIGSKLDAVCEIMVPDEELLRRLAGRWLCKKCGASYQTQSRPPKVQGLCDVCGGQLYQRVDDTPETIKKRLEIYRQETLPLVAYYQKQGILKTIDGTGSLDEISNRLRTIIQKVG